MVATWGRNGRVLRESTSLTKRASHSPAEDYIKNVTPEPGKTIVLVIGLGDNETYGLNRNGDGFPSEPVKGKIAADEVLTKHYKSYKRANVFEHHVNDDPKKAIGRVKEAFWNPYMRRVELLEDFDNAKAPHLLEKIASGQPLAKSMGCRIKYDVCTSCGNKAKTRADYCDHLKYAMSEIDPHTGVQNGALNPSPDFFDSSWVIRPADRTGYMLKKVARDGAYEIRSSSFELGEISDDLKHKSAALAKAADIEKVLKGEPAATVSNLTEGDAKLVEKYRDQSAKREGDNSPDMVRIMISYKPSKAMGTADNLGLPLGLGSLLKYFLGRMAPELTDALDEKTEKSASAHLGLLHETFARYPRFFNDVLKTAQLDVPEHDAALATKLAAYTPPGMEGDYWRRRIVPRSLDTHARPLTDTMNWTDPNTGQLYQTNYGVVQKTHDKLLQQAAKNRALRSAGLFGGSALLGAAGLGLGLMRKTRPMMLPALVGSAGLGLLGAGNMLSPLDMPGPKIRTDEGETISGWTEMMPKHGQHAIAPELAYLIKRASDSRPARLPEAAVNTYWAQIKSAEVRDTDSPLLGHTLDFAKVAEIVGRSILSLAV